LRLGAGFPDNRRFGVEAACARGGVAEFEALAENDRARRGHDAIDAFGVRDARDRAGEHDLLGALHFGNGLHGRKAELVERRD